MARLTAPLLSLGASGSIGKALVFSKWKGIPYARVHVVPTNPDTTAQQEIRNIFRTLNAMWKRLPNDSRLPWNNSVIGLPLTPRNKHIQLNVGVLQGETDLDKLVMSVSRGQAIPPITVEAVDATGQIITVTAVSPTPPVGHTLSRMEACACLDGDPGEPIVVTTVHGFDSATPYSISLDVGVAGDYQVGVWITWERTKDITWWHSAAVRKQVVIGA